MTPDAMNLPTEAPLNVVELLGDLAARDITLWHEDGQLRFRAPRGGLPPEVVALLRQHKPAILAWLIEREAFAAGRADSPLSQGQLGLWLDWQLDPTSSRYHLVSVDRLPDDVDADRLRRAVQALHQRHPVLRTIYPQPGAPEAGDSPLPVQRLQVDAAADFTVIDARGRDAAWVEGWAREFADPPFDLARGPVLRAALLRLAGAGGRVESRLHLAIHHIAADHASLELLRADLERLYRDPDRVVQEAAQDTLGLNDLARWEHDTLVAQGEALAAWWRTQLAGEPPLLDLPTDGTDADGGATRRFMMTLAPKLAVALRALARARGCTLYAVLLSAWQVLLARHGGQRQFLVVSPATTRTLPGWSETVGHFANPVFIQADLQGAPGFAQLLDRTRLAQQQALAHQAWPHAEMMRLLQAHTPPQRLHAGLPAFVFVSRPADEGMADGPALLQPLSSEQLGMPQALTLTVFDRAGTLTAMFTHDGGLFSEARIAAMAARLTVLLQAVVADPEADIDTLPLLTEAERQQLADWNTTEADVDIGRTVVDRFEHWADAQPEAPAVIAVEVRLSFADLEARANRIARGLVERGVGPGQRVGLCVTGTPERVAGVLGILKAGAAYVPLDPDYPAERLRFLVQDCGADIVLTGSAQATQVAALLPPGAHALQLDDDAFWQALPDSRLPRRAGADDPAYVIYTSGSTGAPKGVCVPHGALVNLIESMHRLAPLAPGFTSLALAPFGFDVAVWDLHGTLAFGGTLHLTPREWLLDPVRLAGHIRRHRIDSAYVPPALLEPLLDALGTGPWLGRMLVGVEAIRQGLLQAWQDAAGPQGRVILNGYGPTETTVCSTVHRFRSVIDGEAAAPVPIGRPLCNTRIHILDAQLQLLPPGVPGELCIAGAGLAIGYLGRPDLTAEKFVEVELDGRRERIYRTGDRARWRADGELDCLGRLDHQIKLRGFRIEPGEVEAALVAHPAVVAAAVMVQGQGATAMLVGHVGLKDAQTPGRREALATELRCGLQQRLPAHLVPALLVLHERLPLTPNGKIDRQALAAFMPDDPAGEAVTQAPRTPLELALVALFAELLGRSAVGIHEDFFELGGHSLLALKLVHQAGRQLDRPVTVAQLYRLRTVAALAEALEGPGAGVVPAELAVGPTEPPPDGFLLSQGQRALWFMQQHAPDSTAWHSGLVLRLRGRLPLDGLSQALSDLAERHAALRLVVQFEAGEPVQRVLSPEVVVPAVVDASGLDAAQQAVVVRRAFLQPFDLTRRVWQPTLVRCADDDHALVLSIHHLATDGGSAGLLARDLAEILQARAAGRTPPSVAHHGYHDFVRWESALLTHEGERLRAWWHEQLAGELPVLQLPLDVQRPAQRRFNGRAHVWHLDVSLTQRVQALARRHRVSLFTLLLSVYLVQLHRLTGQSDLLVGTAPEAGRSREAFAPVVGYFVNLIALRSRHDPDAAPAFVDFLAQTAQTVTGALEHQHYPFPLLVQELLPQRDPGVPPLVQALFVLGQQNAGEPLSGGGLTLTPWPLAETGGQGAGQFDLVLLADLTSDEAGEGGERLRLVFDHDADLFRPDTVARLAGQVTTLLEALTAADGDAEGTPIDRLPMLSAADRRNLTAWNATAVDGADAQTVPDLFEDWAARTPEAPAVVFEGQRIDYATLDAWADRIAQRLVTHGVGPNRPPVGLCVRRSPDMIAGLLGILKAGGAYVPLDPDYPPERLRFMLQDCGATTVLTQQSLDAQVAALAPAGCTRLALDEAALWAAPSEGHPPRRARPEDLAYVIYTSGSTGTPKGTLLAHAGAVNLARVLARDLDAGPGSRVLQFAALSFDAAAWEVLMALGCGAALHLAPAERLQGELPALLRDQAITHVTLPPVVLETLPEQPLPHLRTLVVAGEACPAPLVARWRTGRRFINAYGPTEATVCATMQVCEDDGVPAIGRPIANTRVHILDRALQPLPPGVPGELCIAGVGLARGYLNRPELTAEKFITAEVMGRTERLYRSGDLARWRPDGTLEFLGRLDHQVKLRGFRIELGEIEACLAAHPAVAAAAVVLVERGGDRALAAHVGMKDPAADPDVLVATLRAWLQARLPVHMVPTHLRVTERLPLSPNGKIDRRALPAPVASPRAAGPVPLSDPIEQRLAALWQALLPLAPGERIGRDDSFFELGGHSLLLMKMKNRLDDWGVPGLGLVDLFRHPTLATLARHLATLGWGEPPAATAAEPVETSPASDTQRAAARRGARDAGLRQRQIRRAARTEDFPS